MAHQVNQVNKASIMAARLDAAFESWSSVDTSRTVFLGDIPENISRSELQETLNRFGKVLKIALPKELKTKKLKGHGKAVFSDTYGASRALAAKTALVGGHRFQIKSWVDPLTYIQQRDMKAHRKVYIKHKSIHTRESLLHYFQRFGPIEEIDMRFKFNSNHPRNFGYIVFKNDQSAQAAASCSHELLGQIILCEMCRPTDPMGTLTILPSDNNLDHRCDTMLQPDKFWHSIKHLHSIDGPGQISSLIWDEKTQRDPKKETGTYTCQDFKKISSNKIAHAKRNLIKPQNQMTSLNTIPNAQSIGQKQFKGKVYGCNHPEVRFKYNPDLHRLPSIDTQLEEHTTKPTSSKYSTHKRDFINQLHKEFDNIVFTKIRPDNYRMPTLPATRFGF